MCEKQVGALLMPNVYGRGGSYEDEFRGTMASPAIGAESEKASTNNEANRMFLLNDIQWIPMPSHICPHGLVDQPNST